jgi:hypothetical protein
VTIDRLDVRFVRRLRVVKQAQSGRVVEGIDGVGPLGSEIGHSRRALR